MALCLGAAALCLAVAAAAEAELGSAAAMPFPGVMFWPLDPQVGNVEQVPAAALEARVRGRSALIVGGTDGIGRGIALALARAGASVAVVGHSDAKARAVVGNMTAAAPHRSEQRFESYAVDLLTVQGTLGFTRRLNATGTRYDFVALTVGIWPDRQDPRTTDGVDKVIALDVLARFLVAREVAGLLNPGARILSVLGSTVRFPAAPPADAVKAIAEARKTDYSVAEMLGSAGVLADAWLQSAGARFPGIHFVGAWPGIVKTDLIKTSDTFPPWLRPLLAMGQGIVAISAEESGRLLATLLSAPNVARRPTTYFDAALHGRYTNDLAYDVDFVAWVEAFLSDVVARHSGPGGAAARLRAPTGMVV